MPSDATSKPSSALASINLTLILFLFFIILSFFPGSLNLPSFKGPSFNSDEISSTSAKILAFELLVILMRWISPYMIQRLWNLHNGIPGPRFAKLTVLWKVVHCYKGTYKRRVKELHDRYGALVQVGPEEYSVGSPIAISRRFELEKTLSPYFSLLPSLRPQTIERLGETLSMANIFRYESSIDRCNYGLLNALFGFAQSGEEVKMVDLVARYAYDVFFTTIIGESPGFLQQSNVSKVKEAMEHWKFYAIMNGSYLRFHPIIKRALRLFGFGESVTAPIADHLKIVPDGDTHCAYNEIRKDSENQPFLWKEILEACITLMISGSDPAITHILASIYFTYQHTSEHIQALRSEIAKADLSQPPTLKELIHAKPKMPLLHAVLQESRRLCETANDVVSYMSPAGGVEILGQHVPEGCTICLETSLARVNPDIFGVNPDSFDPTRWLEDPAVARGLRSHMITFGANSDICPGEELHLSLVAKLFIQIIDNFDIEMDAVKAFNSPVDGIFSEAKQCFYARVTLPKTNIPTQSALASPLKATTPAFAPETTTAPELPPGLTPTKMSFANADIKNGSYKAVGAFITRVGGAEANINAKESTGQVVTTVSTSPSLSIATTATSSSAASSTPLTWKDEQALEDLLGRAVTNELINRFDPSTNLKTGFPLKTRPLNTPRERYQLHEIIERVWAGRLIHETVRKDNSMHIWVPGSAVPKWLHSLHQTRQLNDRKKPAADKPGSVKNATATHTKGAPVKAPRQVNAVWTNFAVDENVRYDTVASMTGDEYVAMMAKKAEQNGVKKSEDGAPKVTFKETFKLTGGDKTKTTTTVTDASADTPKVIIPPHLRARMALPPHLRAKSSDAPVAADKVEEKTPDTKNEQAEWIAAKLPAPLASD